MQRQAWNLKTHKSETDLPGTAWGTGTNSTTWIPSLIRSLAGGDSSDVVNIIPGEPPFVGRARVPSCSLGE